MKSLAILSTQSISTQSNGLSTNSTKANEGGDSFKQVLSQKVSAEPKQQVQPSHETEQTQENDSVASANDQVEQADVKSTDNAQLLELSPMSAKSLKAHLQADKRVSSKKEGDNEELPQEPNAASLVASLQLPAMGVKPIDTTVEKSVIGDKSSSLAESGVTQSITAHQKIASKLEDKLDKQDAKVEKWEAQDNPDKNSQAMTSDNKAEKFSEQVNAKIAEKIQAFTDKQTAYAVGKSAVESAPKLADTLPTLQTVASQAQAMNDVAESGAIKATVGQPGWNEAVNQKVVWMVGAQEQTATLTLNPPDMGPLQVVVSVNNDKADTTFVTDNPEVRKALQDGLADLRNQLDQAGVTLGQANVSTNQQYQDFRQSSGERFSQQQQANSATSSVSPVVQQVKERQAAVRTNLGLVDTFA